MATITFKNDILPLFKDYQPYMIWRFDITDYDTVSRNAQMIYGRLQGTTGTQMPPPELPPFTNEQIAMFGTWIAEGCQP